MNKIFDDKMLNQIIDYYLKNEKLINEIKKLLNLKKALNTFATIPLEFSENCSEDSENIFLQLLSSRILAQKFLNLYYNNGYYQSCTLSNVMSDISQQYACLKVDVSDSDSIVPLIVRYVVLFHILYKRENALELRFQKEKRRYVGLCGYCDAEIHVGDEECSICSMRVKNKTLEENNVDNITENKNGTMKNNEIKYEENDHSAEESQNNQWTCVSCTFINSISKKECGACSFIRSKDTDHKHTLTSLDNSTEDTSKEKWTCASCTFINSINQKECGACGAIHALKVEKNFTIKRDITNVREASEDMWKCTYCHHDNLFHKYICQSCHKKADSLHMWRCEKCLSFNDDKEEHCKKCITENKDKESLKIEESKECEDVISKMIKVLKQSEIEDDFINTDICEVNSCDDLSNKNIIPLSWICKDKSCGEVNDFDKDVCHKCKLNKDCSLSGFI